MTTLKVFLLHTGKGMVPEQTDEVEAGEGRSAGSRCAGERTGERKERNSLAF